MTILYQNLESQLQSKKSLRIIFLLYVGIVMILFTVRALTYIYILNDSFVAREFGVDTIEIQNRNFSFSKFGYIILWTETTLEIFFSLIVIYAGILYFGLKELSFIKLARIFLISYYLFVIENIVEFLYLLINRERVTLYQVREFSTFSLKQLLPNASQIYDYPLRVLNLWELGFVIILIFGVKSLARNLNYSQIIKVISCSYGLGVFIWLLAAVYVKLIL